MSDEEVVKRPNHALRLISNLQREYDKRGDRIEALTEQLEAARADAKEAEAYAEELAGDQVDLCRQLIDAEDKLAECEARLGKAVEALEIIRDRQFYRMGPGITAQVIARATLAEIEGEQP
jgi:predicted  nucleic acid-binding Zn-ribbon protein